MTSQRYTMQDLYKFMESGKSVKVICTDGKCFTGPCWAYSDTFNMEEEGVDEPSIEVQDVVVFLHEVQSIEFVE